MTLLSIQDLSVALPKKADRDYAVRDASFDLSTGELLCIVGESGSGKSMTANALMGLLPPGVRIAGGRAIFDGQDLTAMPEREQQRLRGADMAMIFQEPMTALNPLLRIGDQIAEVFEAHGRLKPDERIARAIALADEVGLPDPKQIVRAYPFQLSGGQRQRAMIAMALALEPKLLIADEPTTALDVTTQAQILRLIQDLREKRGMGVLLITHDLGVVAEIDDRLIDIRHGENVESGKANADLKNPQHAYTRELLDAIPTDIVTQSTKRENVPALEVVGLNKTFTSCGGFLRKK
ncbi:MAG: ABC transporter ATP-binding protein, partial [Pseudomonadota bacterium]